MNEISNVDKILYSKVSLEKDYRTKTNKLGWGDFTDVLYSFLGVFVVGLKVYCGENKCANLLEIWAKNNKKGNYKIEYSWNFIRAFIEYYSKEVDGEENKKIKIAVDELINLKEINNFISVYSSIGNVFPIWPGGNVNRGTKGCYDFPDIYFNTEGIHNYSEHFYNSFCANNFMEKIRYGKYKTLTRESMLMFNKVDYGNFLIYIYDTICERAENINIILK